MKTLSRIAASAAAAAMCLIAVAPVAGAQEPASVPYSYLAGLAAQLGAPGAPPPGANDRTCHPGAAHPNPVVLLHGLGNETVTWQTLSPLLAAEGYCVYTTTYGTGAFGPALGAVAPVPESARQIGAFIDRVLAATGASKVDLVGHSMGGAVPFYYFHHLGGAEKVARHIGLGAPYHGSTLSGADTAAKPLRDLPGTEDVVAGCGPCQMSPDSPFLNELKADAGLVPGVQFVSIVSRYDEIATPYTTGMLHGPNARNIVLQDVCATDYSEHYGLTSDPVAVREVLNALDPEHSRPAECPVVAPIVGPLTPVAGS
ncbi:esterase/lipase family protein [Nocardia araoensis]|uniref:esterase/lipase family protein n=1 Tax=Nocardia araoensis TaxID=228600 RepID=UPI00031E6693|nr:alpha/beta fold hydrolase [Nocardia araoensis]